MYINDLEYMGYKCVVGKKIKDGIRKSFYQCCIVKDDKKIKAKVFLYNIKSNSNGKVTIVDSEEEKIIANEYETMVVDNMHKDDFVLVHRHFSRTIVNIERLIVAAIFVFIIVSLAKKPFDTSVSAIIKYVSIVALYYINITLSRLLLKIE